MSTRLTNQPLADTIAANMRRLRQGRGISQRALAAAAGVSSPAVSGWEDGAAAISAEHLVAVASVLGVSVLRLVGDGGTDEFWDGYACGWDACRSAVAKASEPPSRVGV